MKKLSIITIMLLMSIFSYAQSYSKSDAIKVTVDKKGVPIEREYVGDIKFYTIGDTLFYENDKEELKFEIKSIKKRRKQYIIIAVLDNEFYEIRLSRHKRYLTGYFNLESDNIILFDKYYHRDGITINR